MQRQGKHRAESWTVQGLALLLKAGVLRGQGRWKLEGSREFHKKQPRQNLAGLETQLGGILT